MMLVLRLTQKLVKDMNADPVVLDEVPSFFSWHVNILQLRRKHIIFVNDLTRLGLIIDGVRSSQLAKLQEKFKAELKGYLLFEGLRRSLIEQYFLQAGELRIGKTTDRSVLGTMTEMSIHCKAMDFDHAYDLSGWLNSMIYKPIDYQEPIHVFKKTIEEKYR